MQNYRFHVIVADVISRLMRAGVVFYRRFGALNAGKDVTSGGFEELKVASRGEFYLQ